MVLRALGTVFCRGWYIVATGVISIGITVVTFLWPNFALLTTVWSSDITSVAFKVALTQQLLVGSLASMGLAAVIVVSITALLIGMVTSMGWYAWQSKQATRELRTSFTSTGFGLFAALLGIGCIACGPLLVTSLLALVGGAGLLLVLPLHGAELGYIAIVLLLFALYTLAKVVTAPAICAPTLQ